MRWRSLRSSASAAAVGPGRPDALAHGLLGRSVPRADATSAIACGDAAWVPVSVGLLGSASVASVSTAEKDSVFGVSCAAP